MTLVIEGSVTSGLGKGEEFVTLNGYAEQFQSKLGYEPFPGTLNLEVDDPVHGRLAELESIPIEEWEDDGRTFGGVDCYPAVVESNDDSPLLHAIVPRRTDHDTSTVELVSPVNLRETLDLSDGTSIEIRVTPRSFAGE